MVPNDPKEHACCAAQMFLIEGDAVVFRGAKRPIENRRLRLPPHSAGSKKLVAKVLDTFKDKHGAPPRKFFIHG